MIERENDTHDRKNKSPEGKFSCLAKVSEVRKVLLACEPSIKKTATICKCKS